MPEVFDTIRLYECGICDCLHPWLWSGDCREDANRFADEYDYLERMGIPNRYTSVEVFSMDERVAADARGEA